MKAYCIDDFKNGYEKLLKKPKHYRCITERLIKVFELSSHKEIKKDLIYENAYFVLYKTRVQSCTGGKSYGFRIYFLWDKVNERLAFLELYPKFGTYSEMDKSDANEVQMVNDYANQIEALFEVSISKKKIDFTSFIKESISSI